jgi:hypothetical protein
MTQLTADVSATATHWPVDSAVPSATVLQVDDEIVRVAATYYTRGQISVLRAQEGTTAATHASGTELVTAFGGGGGSVEQAMQARSTILTYAQIKAWPTTAIELVPAPGAGSMIVAISAVLRLTWVADYTNIDADCKLAVTQSTVNANAPALLTILHENPDISVSGLLALGDSAFAMVGPRMYGAAAVSDYVHGAGGLNTFLLEDVALYLRATNGAAGAFTGGDAGNSLKVTVLYTVIEV